MLRAAESKRGASPGVCTRQSAISIFFSGKHTRGVRVARSIERNSMHAIGPECQETNRIQPLGGCSGAGKCPGEYRTPSPSRCWGKVFTQPRERGTRAGDVPRSDRDRRASSKEERGGSPRHCVGLWKQAPPKNSGVGSGTLSKKSPAKDSRKVSGEPGCAQAPSSRSRSQFSASARR